MYPPPFPQKHTQKLVQTWPAGKIRRIGSRVRPEFAFQTCKTQKVLCTDAFTTAITSLRYSGMRWSSREQQTEAGSDVITPLTFEITWFSWQRTETAVGSYHKKLSWRLCLLHVCQHFFTWRYWFSFCYIYFCICRSVRSVINTPTHSSEGPPCCRSYIKFSWCSTVHYKRRPGREIQQKLWNVCLRHLHFTHVPPLGKTTDKLQSPVQV